MSSTGRVGTSRSARPVRCVVIVPMLGRGHLMDRLRVSLADSTDRARILWVVTSGDFDVLDHLGGDARVIVPPKSRGDYAHKVNAGVLASDEPLILTAAIDLHFHEGWLEAAERMLNESTQVVGTNDLANPRTADGHSTHTLVTREYVGRGLIDGRPGLLCEDYIHEYVDDEMIGTARKRGVYAHAVDSVVEHLHPMVGKAEWDDTYRGMKRRMRIDRGLYNRRRQLWM